MKTRSTFSLLVFFCLTNLVFANSLPIPFKLAGKLIVIRAVVDGKAGNFILDTGISHLVLNAEYFKGDKAEKIYHGVNGKTGKIETTFLKVAISAHQWKNVYAEIIPLQHLESLKGMPIHGLIGGKMLRNYELYIDFQAEEIELYKLDKNGLNPYMANRKVPTETLSFRYKGSTPSIKAQIGSTILTLTVDTGAETNLIHERYKPYLLNYLYHPKEKMLNSFSKKFQKVTSSKLSQLKVGKIICQPMNTLFIPLAEWDTAVSGPKVHGILGYEFLYQFHIAINFKKREIYLWQQKRLLNDFISSGKK